jgi:hypothetical protein
MVFAHNHFWNRIAAAHHHGAAGETDRARIALEAALEIAAGDSSSAADRRRALVRQLAGAYRVAIDPDAVPLQGSGDHSAEGISLITACRNRNANLKRALPSWLACPQITEVVIVDWTSDTPVAEDLAASGLTDPRIRVLRVEDEPRWVLGYPFNLGFQSARAARILKADADIVIQPDFFRRNSLRQGAFIAGNWRTAAKDQAFVNGFFYIERASLVELGGFNEYITSYGWDDEELYARLCERGLNREEVAGGSITHLPHDDAKRTDHEATAADAPAAKTLPNQTAFLIRRNRYIANIMPAWSENRPSARYETLDSNGPVTRLRRIAGSACAVPDTVQREADLAAARELLSWRLGDECYMLDLDQVEYLIGESTWDALTLTQVRQVLRQSETAQPPPVPGPRPSRAKLFIDAQHGLGNRMRAIGSAAAVAEAEDRELVIVWRPDHHCECRFEELFDYGGAVREDIDPDGAARSGASIYNYMEIEPGALKDALVSFQTDNDVYFRSAFVMNHPASDWEAENRFLKTLSPVAPVCDLVASVRSPNDVAAHVRMAGGPQFEHLPWESAANWKGEAHASVAHWRKQSHYDRFLLRLAALIEAGEAETFFVAADLPETYATFQARFGDRAAHLPRSVNDRSRDQLQYALADAILLGRAPRLLGSTWSSFSELAMRLAEPGLTVEMTGKDF